jgi:hypothetical protein
MSRDRRPRSEDDTGVIFSYGDNLIDGNGGNGGALTSASRR